MSAATETSTKIAGRAAKSTLKATCLESPIASMRMNELNDSRTSLTAARWSVRMRSIIECAFFVTDAVADATGFDCPVVWVLRSE